MVEMGVGADIASGNQVENGNWALLVNEHKIIMNMEILDSDIL